MQENKRCKAKNKQFTNNKNKVHMKKQMNLFVTILALFGSIFFLTGCQQDEVAEDVNANITSNELTSKTMDDFQESDITSVGYVESLAYEIWDAKEDGVLTLEELKAIESIESNDLLLALMVTEDFPSVDEYIIDKDYAIYGAWKTDDGSIAIRYPVDHPKYDATKVPVLPSFSELSGDMSAEMYIDLVNEMKGYVTGDALRYLENRALEAEQMGYSPDSLEISESARASGTAYKWTGGAGRYRWYWFGTKYPAEERVGFNPCTSYANRTV